MTDLACSTLFQFQYGSIKSESQTGKPLGAYAFQFQYGSIKSHTWGIVHEG